MARADKPLLHNLETRVLLHTPCRALLRGYKRLRSVTYPLKRGRSRVWAPALLQAFGFDRLPYLSFKVTLALNL